MKVGKFLGVLFAAAAVILPSTVFARGNSLLLAAGSGTKVARPAVAGKSAKKAVVLCKGCGQIKGSDVCCKEGQTKCAGCKLTKGSPGCCKIPSTLKGAAVLCGKCGEIKGTDKCCKKAGRESCGKCNLFKGSPGCCKMGK